MDIFILYLAYIPALARALPFTQWRQFQKGKILKVKGYEKDCNLWKRWNR